MKSKENVESYLKDIARHLWESRLYGAASVMVGAGFSKNAISIGSMESIPDWNELSGEIFSALYPEPKEKSEKIVWDENCPDCSLDQDRGLAFLNNFSLGSFDELSSNAANGQAATQADSVIVSFVTSADVHVNDSSIAGVGQSDSV